MNLDPWSMGLYCKRTDCYSRALHVSPTKEFYTTAEGKGAKRHEAPRNPKKTTASQDKQHPFRKAQYPGHVF